MKKIGLSLALGALMLTGCVSQGNVAPGQYAPLQELTTDATYDVLQRVEGTSSGTTLLYLFPIGFEDKKGQAHAASNDGSDPFSATFGAALGWLFEFSPGERVRDAALYNAIEAHDSADAILAPRYDTRTTNYLLFQHVEATARGKAVRYNPTVTE